MSYGLNSTTGLRIDGVLYIEQSIAQIMTTPIGSRVMRRDFGSLLPELIDRPLNSETQLLIYAATATALHKWEPRFVLSKVELNINDMTGSVELKLNGAVKLGSSWVTGNSLAIRLVR